MSSTVCPQCGAPIDPSATECKFCGEKLSTQQASQSQQGGGNNNGQPTIIIQNGPAQPQPQPVYVTAINPTWPVKSKTTAGILAILLGGIGVHKFYLGKIGSGLLYLCFCWTGVPALLGIFEGIGYLISDDEKFQLKNHVRIG